MTVGLALRANPRAPFVRVDHGNCSVGACQIRMGVEVGPCGRNRIRLACRSHFLRRERASSLFGRERHRDDVSHVLHLRQRELRPIARPVECRHRSAGEGGELAWGPLSVERLEPDVRRASDAVDKGQRASVGRPMDDPLGVRGMATTGRMAVGTPPSTGLRPASKSTKVSSVQICCWRVSQVTSGPRSLISVTSSRNGWSGRSTPRKGQSDSSDSESRSEVRICSGGWLAADDFRPRAHDTCGDRWRWTGVHVGRSRRAAPHLASGALIRVLEDCCPPFPGFFLYYPSRRQQPAARSALIDTLRLQPSSALRKSRFLGGGYAGRPAAGQPKLV
jgi:hypothetical protein